jgi:hypothetical protein
MCGVTKLLLDAKPSVYSTPLATSRDVYSCTDHLLKRDVAYTQQLGRVFFGFLLIAF